MHIIKENTSLSFELLVETLVDFGFKPTDAQVYIFIAKKGPQRGKDLVSSLRITKQQLYPSLKNLQERGIVNATLERPATFSAISIEEVLDALIKNKIQETDRLIQTKKETLSKWKSMMRNDSETQISGKNPKKEKGGFAGEISTGSRGQVHGWLNLDRGTYKNGRIPIIRRMRRVCWGSGTSFCIYV